jgi:hypothetical protein
VLLTEPTQFYAGDTLQWEKSWTDYPADGGWNLAYRLVNPKQSIPIASGDITSAGSFFEILIPAAETAEWTPGEYTLIGVVSTVPLQSDQSQQSEQLGAPVLDMPTVGWPPVRYTVVQQRITVLQDPMADEGYDYRSENEKALAAVNAMLADRGDVDSYTLPGGIQLTKSNRQQLEIWQQKLAGRVMRERGQLPSTVGARFQ